MKRAVGKNRQIEKDANKKAVAKKVKTPTKKEIQQVRTEIAKKNFLAALKQSLGIVSNACTISKISRAVYYQWLDKDPDFKKEVEEVSEHVLDFVETSLLKQVKDANTTATIFYLKTKGKKRGYIEANVNINREVTDLTELSDEELDAIIMGNTSYGHSKDS